MHISLIPSLAPNSEDRQLRVHSSGARRFVDHLTGDQARNRNNRVGDTGNTRLRTEEGADRAGQRQTGRGPS